MLQSPGQLTGVSVQGTIPPAWPKDDILHAQMRGGRLDSLQAGEYHIVLGAGVASRPQGLHRRPGASHPDRRYPLLPLWPGAGPASFTVSGIFGVGADVDSQVALIALGMPSVRCACPQTRWAASASGWTIPSPPTRW